MNITHPITPAERAMHELNRMIAHTASLFGPAPRPEMPRTATSMGMPQCADEIPVPCCQGIHRCTRVDGHTGLHEHLTPSEESQGLPPEYRWWRMTDGTVIL